MQHAARFRGSRIVLPKSASNRFNQVTVSTMTGVRVFERACFNVPRKFAVDCNFSVAELSLSPAKSGTKLCLAFFSSNAESIFVCSARYRVRVPLPFCSEEIMHDERLIGVNSQGVGFSDEISVTDFICSAA
jgi:hypothetical protein